MIRDWAERRLLSMSTAASATFVQFRDWVVLQQRMQVDSIAGLITVIKEHIESEDTIRARVTLEGAHLHQHPNVRLRAPTPEEIPPPLEGVAPFRWTIEQLDGLLDVFSAAARALSPTSRELPSRYFFTVLARLTRPSGSDAGAKEQPQVPVTWRSCDTEKLQSLFGLFDRPPSTGTIDCAEFLLHIGLLHSPLGWPSVETLVQVRKSLEAQVPAGTAWPDFWITQDKLAELPVFSDPSRAEAAFADKFRVSTASTTAAFDRPKEQLLWICRVLQRFPAPLRQCQSWELETSWYDYQVRSAEDAERISELLDDAKSTSSNSPRQAPDSMTPLLVASPLTGEPDTPALGSGNGDASMDSGAARPHMPRPVAPTGLPQPPATGAVNVRQLLTFLCEGSSPEDGITRALNVLCPSAGTAVMPEDIHAVLLQFGARSTPSSLEGDGRPAYPSLEQLCEELELSHAGLVNGVELAKGQCMQRLLARTGLGLRHSRAEVEKLFLKNPRKPRPE